MANKVKIGASLFLEGEKEFRRSITQINAELGTNASELKVVDAQYAANDKSAEALTARIKTLREQVALKTEKVKQTEAALNAAKEAYGENDKKVLAWQKSLNLARADLIKTNDSLDDNEKALKKAETGTTSLADAVTGLADMCGISVPPAMQGMINKLDGVSASGAALVGVLAGIVAGLANMTVDTAKSADEILTLSSTTGLSTQALQEFQYASELVDVDLDTMTGSMTKMIKSMSSAAKGTGDAAEAYKKLHVKVTDSKGDLRDANEVYYEVIDALGKVSNETERDSMAMEIFGKSARELNPLIEAGSGKLKELAAEAENMGYVMDDKTLAAFGELDDAMQRFNNQTTTLKNSLAVAMLPVLTDLFEAIGKIPTPVLQTLVVLAGVVTTVILAVKAIKEMTSTASTISGFFKSIDPVALKTTAIVLGVVAALIALAAIIAVLAGKTNDIKSVMSSVGGATQQITSTTAQIQSGRVPSYARGTDYHPGGFAIVGENGPELVSLPKGSAVSPSGSYGGDTFNITIDAKNVREFNDIVSMAQKARQERRAR